VPYSLTASTIATSVSSETTTSASYSSGSSPARSAIHSMAILSAANVRPMSAKELEQICDVSLPTVYRRINVLVECGLLSEQQDVDRKRAVQTVSD